MRLLGYKFLIIILPFYSVFSKDLTLNDRFGNADYLGKQKLIDSLIVLDPPQIQFFDKLINTDDFIANPELLKTFGSTDVYRAFQERLIYRIIVNNDSAYSGILYNFIYPQKKARPFQRLQYYRLKYERQTKITSSLDNDGTEWALITRSNYGCLDDLWLISRLQADTMWSGPLFTGHTLHVLPRVESCSLLFINGRLFLSLPERQIKDDISPSVLIVDSDNDGFFDIEESRFMTDINNPDTDLDGIFDGEDLNPLSPGKANLSPEDSARTAVFRLKAQVIQNEPVVYLLHTDGDPNVEYFTSSPNAIIIQLDTLSEKKFTPECPRIGTRRSRMHWVISASAKNDTTIQAQIKLPDSVFIFEIKNRNKRWMISKLTDAYEYIGVW